VEQLAWPPTLAHWIGGHYKVAEVCGYTELHSPTEAVRCHPGYRGGPPWYDWVLIDDAVSGNIVPAKLWTVVMSPRDGSMELIATVARVRTSTTTATIKLNASRMHITVSYATAKKYLCCAIIDELTPLSPTQPLHSRMVSLLMWLSASRACARQQRIDISNYG
jgi:hypothetical protein